MGRVLGTLESALDVEKERGDALEKKLEEVIQHFDMERKGRENLEAKVRQMAEDIMDKDRTINSLDQENSALKSDVTHMRNDLIGLRDENTRIQEFFDNKIRDTEIRHQTETKNQQGEIDALRA